MFPVNVQMLGCYRGRYDVDGMGRDTTEVDGLALNAQHATGDARQVQMVMTVVSPGSGAAPARDAMETTALDAKRPPIDARRTVSLPDQVRSFTRTLCSRSGSLA
jgi:hypothetical protein